MSPGVEKGVAPASGKNTHTITVGSIHSGPLKPTRTREPMPPQQSVTPLDRPFNVMAKPIGPTCNLACEYCYYLDKTELYPERADFRMSEEMLETDVRQYIEAHPGPTEFGSDPTVLEDHQSGSPRTPLSEPATRPVPGP